MPIPDIHGIPPFADFDGMRSKVNELVQKYNNLLVSLDSLNVVSISSGTVVIYDLDGGSGTITLTKDGMVINDGTKDTFKVDINGHVTMTGAQVQSADGTYPRIELSASDELLRASLDATHYIYIDPDFVGGTPALVWQDPASSVQMFILPDGSGDFMFNPTQKLKIVSSSNDIHLQCAAGHVISVNSWNQLYNRFNGISLQSELNAKANAFSGYTGSFSTGTNTVFVSNGIITSVV